MSTEKELYENPDTNAQDTPGHAKELMTIGSSRVPTSLRARFERSLRTDGIPLVRARISLNTRVGDDKPEDLEADNLVRNTTKLFRPGLDFDPLQRVR